jgi:hypothetical protein
VIRIELAGEEEYVSADSAVILLLVPVEGKTFDNSVVVQFEDCRPSAAEAALKIRCLRHG